MSPDEPPVRPPAPRMALRRAIFAGLVVFTMALLAAWFLRLSGANGLTWPEGAMFALYVVTLPWIVIGFWNALIGLVILSWTTIRCGGSRRSPRLSPMRRSPSGRRS